MMWPKHATKIEIYFGAVYITSPSFPDEKKGLWTVWDPREVRQGAKLVQNGLSLAQACSLAKRIQEV